MRRRRDDDIGQFEDEQPAASAPAKKPAAAPRRGGKPLKDRSPIIPGVFALICLAGAMFTFFAYSPNKLITTVHRSRHIRIVKHVLANHHVVYVHHVYYTHKTLYARVPTTPSTFTILLVSFYVLLAIVEAYITFRIYRARGSWF